MLGGRKAGERGDGEARAGFSMLLNPSLHQSPKPAPALQCARAVGPGPGGQQDQALGKSSGTGPWGGSLMPQGTADTPGDGPMPSVTTLGGWKGGLDGQRASEGLQQEVHEVKAGSGKRQSNTLPTMQTPNESAKWLASWHSICSYGAGWKARLCPSSTTSV